MIAQNSVFLFLCLFAFDAFGQASLKGQVIEEGTNQPIPFAKIEIRGVGEMQADSLGFFEVPNLAPAQYYVIARQEGYLIASVLVEIQKSPTNIALELKKLPPGKSTRLNNIYFKPKSAHVSDPDSAIFQLVEIMNKNQGIVLEISGHSDVFECGEKEITLSTQRAEAVVQLLIKNGVPASRIAARAYGGTRPAYPCKLEDGTMDEEGCAGNRRVAFAIVGSITMPVLGEQE